MQHIDENTFIAETLVTYSEYQPFIDEMREKGEDHQPDHWAFYQFPEGSTQEPILGIWQTDVLAFCAWLSNRDHEWHYHLPTLAISLTQSLLEEIQSEKMRLPLLLKLTNFLTLHERIEGRSPVYEGIRLVKQRWRL